MPLHLGTSSWSEPGWVGPFDPAGTKAQDFLGEYARVFSAVEADTTYYRVPSASMVAGWRERTPDGFLIAVHRPRRARPPPCPGRPVRPGRHSAVPGGPKAGPLLLQFP